MDLLAATATTEPDTPWGWLVALLALATLVYAASCTWWPFAKCWCCEGSGRHSRKDRKVFRPCRWCRGSGRRLRLGRRTYNFIRKRQRDAG